MGTIALKDATLIPVSGERIERGTLVIDGDRIAAAGPSSQVEIPEEAEVIDCRGKHVLPGLVDTHIHLDLHGMSDTSHEGLVEDKLRAIRASLEMGNTIRSGITTVRNAGSTNYIDIAVKRAVEQEFAVGPRILTSGRIICMHTAGNEYFPGLYREADGVDENRRAAREQLKEGADYLKVMATGAIMNPGGVPGTPHLNMEEIQAVVEEAEKTGTHTAAHAHGAEGIKNAVRAGVRTIEHGTLADDEVLTMMADRGIYLTSTLSSNFWMLQASLVNGIPQFMLEKAREVTKIRKETLHRAIDRGVPVIMGTDAGTPDNFHGKNAMELVRYVQEGLMTEMEAIRTSTLTAAEALGLGESIGSLEKGKYADLLVLECDPLRDIECLARLDDFAFIFKEGRIVNGAVDTSKWTAESPLGLA
ncbi:MAG: amidohydrolase family protein [Desulfohalobiaceae bacterium]